jgi:hypothetical protein
MAKRPAISKGPDKAPKSDEFQTFERGLRKVLSVPKKFLRRCPRGREASPERERQGA